MKTAEYLAREGLLRFLPKQSGEEFSSDPFASVRASSLPAFPPDVEDLARLHLLVRTRRAFTVLEFGTGFSTIVIADALAKNKREWFAAESRPHLRNRHLFRCFSVDASSEWLGLSEKRFPVELREHVEFHFSNVVIGTHKGQLCHFYENLPDIVPDFIYLDGPDPKDVKGSVRGLSFQADERTVMSGDLLLMEPTLLPGAFVLVDGRTNNARFLNRNFKRPFAMRWDQAGDVTTFELTEERLGKLNILGTDMLPPPVAMENDLAPAPPEPSVYVRGAASGDKVVTRASLVRDLNAVGIAKGDIICVHAAFSRLGLVAGGTATVLAALRECVGGAGTLMMPTFSGDLSDPGQWSYPAVPSELVDEVRASLRGYDPRHTPTKNMGVLAELFRHEENAIRSPHPQSSFTAVGPHAAELCGTHALNFRFGPDSPLGVLCRLGGKVLLLGAPWNTVSLFYLTEFNMPDRKERRHSSPVLEGGSTVWKSYRDLIYRNDWHDAVIHLVHSGLATRRMIGCADSVVFAAEPAIREISDWRLSRC